MSGTRFADCYRCGLMFEDVESIIFAGGGWCPPCERPAQRQPD